MIDDRCEWTADREIERLKRRIKELEATLRPFALMWDDNKINSRNRLLDLKRASKIYHKKDD